MGSERFDTYEAEIRPAHELFALYGAGAATATDDYRLRPESAAEPVQAAQASPVVHEAYLDEHARLSEALLARIHINSPQFFEHLIVDVLLRLGYGGRHRDLARCIGQSHDGGIDAMIARDELGLDMVYVQAKRLRPGTLVPISQVRDFAGSLEARRAASGIFVTTARFSASAYEFTAAVSRRVVLVDGLKLADIMIRHNIGVAVRETYQFKDIVPEYFRTSPLRG
jgi:restriction system protein